MAPSTVSRAEAEPEQSQGALVEGYYRNIQDPDAYVLELVLPGREQPAAHGEGLQDPAAKPEDRERPPRPSPSG